MEVSVLVGVYKAENYLRQAVESALAQPETAEVVLVEDGSPDNSWAVCQELANTYSNVYLHRHRDGKNHGCGATRNVLVQKSTCEYVAFLDADDYFLPNRFTVAKQVFGDHSDIDGVYEAVSMHIEDEAAFLRWKDAGRGLDPLHTMTRRVPPAKLFSALVNGGAGSFSIDGLVLRRSVFEKCGYFNEDLSLHMDDVLFIKLAAVAKLMAGRLNEPVAMWRVHDHNRISARRPKSLIYQMKLKYWFTLWNWGRTHLNREQSQVLLQALLSEARFKSRFQRSFPRWLYGIQQRLQLGLLPFSYPAILVEPSYWRSFVPSPRKWFRRK